MDKLVIMAKQLWFNHMTLILKLIIDAYYFGEKDQNNFHDICLIKINCKFGENILADHKMSTVQNYIQQVTGIESCC